MRSFQQPLRPRQTALLVLLAWFVLTFTASFSGAFSQGDALRPPIRLAFVALVPVSAFLAALTLSPRFRSFLGSLDLRLLTLSQFGRIAGVVFLPLYAAGKLPAGFALPAGLGDAAIALTAPLVAMLIVPRLPAYRGLYVTWAALGILDLVVALSTGLLHSGTSLGVPASPVTTAVMGTLPLSIIPTFLVPLAIVMHIAALRIVLARATPRDVMAAAR